MKVRSVGQDLINSMRAGGENCASVSVFAWPFSSNWEKLINGILTGITILPTFYFFCPFLFSFVAVVNRASIEKLDCTRDCMAVIRKFPIYNQEIYCKDSFHTTTINIR